MPILTQPSQFILAWNRHQIWWLAYPVAWFTYLLIYNNLLTHTHTQPFYGSLGSVRDNPGEPVPQKTFTHSHLLWSSVIRYLLPPSITIHGILSVQFMCLTVFFHNLSPSFLSSTSWSGTLHFILHTFLHTIIVFFLQHMPISLQPVLL